MTGPRIAYIMSRFPGLSETFILREMCELERLGWNLELYPLIFQQETVVHDDALTWMERAHKPSLYAIAAANLDLLVTHPIVYISILFKALLGNILSIKFLIRAFVLYPKAVWMARQMKTDKVVHIHAHYATHPALVAWIINQITGISYSVTAHAHDIFVDKSMIQQKLQGTSFIVTISCFNRDYLIKYLGPWVGEKIKVIHCGIVPSLYTLPAPSELSPENLFDIISIGSLRPYKGFAYLLEACNILRQRDLRFRCRIIGGGELHARLYSKIEELKLLNFVELLGPKDQNEVAGFLKNADCYVQSSIVTSTGKMEGIPVSLMEAMASGLPVVATNISGIPELVRPGETGYLVPPEEPQALADAIMKIYEDRGRAEHYAITGRDLVLKEFNLSTNVALLSDLLNSYLEGVVWK